LSTKLAVLLESAQFRLALEFTSTCTLREHQRTRAYDLLMRKKRSVSLERVRNRVRHEDGIQISAVSDGEFARDTIGSTYYIIDIYSRLEYNYQNYTFKRAFRVVIIHRARYSAQLTRAQEYDCARDALLLHVFIARTNDGK